MNYRTPRTEHNHFAAILAEPGNGLREGAYRYALTLTANIAEAEELTQEALYRAIKAKGGYDPRRSPAPWLCIIVRNVYFDRLRQRRIRRTHSLEELGGDRKDRFEPSADDPGPLSELLSLENASRVQETLGGLRPALRKALQLRHLKGLSYKEIADATKTPLNTVRSRLARATESFRKRYSEGG